jgi:hypothetical protein
VSVASGAVYADTIISGDLQLRDGGKLYFPGGSYQDKAQMVGPPGPAGGPPNTLTIGNVQTGNPGTAAGATITGAAPNQVLNLLIPQGAQGTTSAENTTFNKTSTSLKSNNVQAALEELAPTIDAKKIIGTWDFIIYSNTGADLDDVHTFNDDYTCSYTNVYKDTRNTYNCKWHIENDRIIVATFNNGSNDYSYYYYIIRFTDNRIDCISPNNTNIYIFKKKLL